MTGRDSQRATSASRSRWQMYLLLGKLKTAASIFRK